MNSRERLFAPSVVSQARPGALQQHAAQHPRAPFADFSRAIRFTGLVLLGRHAEVAGEMPGVLKTVRVIDRRDEHLGGLAAHAGDRHHSSDLIVVGREPFQSCFDRCHLGDQFVELPQLAVELSLPKVVGSALLDGLAKRVDVQSSGVPGPRSGIDLDAPVGECRTDAVLDTGDAVIEVLAILDDRSLLSDLGLGDMDAGEVFHHRHLG